MQSAWQARMPVPVGRPDPAVRLGRLARAAAARIPQAGSATGARIIDRWVRRKNLLQSVTSGKPERVQFVNYLLVGRALNSMMNAALNALRPGRVVGPLRWAIFLSVIYTQSGGLNPRGSPKRDPGSTPGGSPRCAAGSPKAALS